MDRYWISKKEVGNIKTEIPSESEIDKYGKVEQILPSNISKEMEMKAEISAKIVKIKSPWLHNDEFFKECAKYMDKGLVDLQLLYGTMKRFE